MPSLRPLTLAAAAGFAATGAFAQTLPSGVIDAPPTVIGDYESIGANTTLIVNEGGLVSDYFHAMEGSSVIVHAGSIGSRFSTGGFVEINGGTVGDEFWAIGDSEVRIGGGEVSRLVANEGSKVKIAGGSLGGLLARGSAVVSMTGGFSQYASVPSPAATFNLSGGEISESLSAFLGTVNVAGRAFYLDGEPIDLAIGIPRVIDDRSSVLTATLEDGGHFMTVLAPNDEGYISPEATLTVTLVPDPGDYNGDGQVDAADFTVLQSRYGEEAIPYSYADGNGDGRINAADYTVWRDNVAPAIAESLAEVPEPASVVLLGLALVSTTSRKRERPE